MTINSTPSALAKYQVYCPYETKTQNTTRGIEATAIVKEQQQQQQQQRQQQHQQHVHCSNTKQPTTNQPPQLRVSFDVEDSFSVLEEHERSSDCFHRRSSGGAKTPRRLSMRDYYAQGGTVGSMRHLTASPSSPKDWTTGAEHFWATAEDDDEDDDEEHEEEPALDAARDNDASAAANTLPLPARLPLSEDVYAFIAVCPMWSVIFPLSLYVIFVKYTIYAILLSDIDNDDEYHGTGVIPLVQVVKFFLIPVAVTMQDDLMIVYATLANTKWDTSVTRESPHATFPKFIVATTLRGIDGMFSLTVCFYLMLMTNTILDVFLNFAALHFLQFIDDIAYEMVDRGFFGDRLEYAATACQHVSYPRRVATETTVRDDTPKQQTTVDDSRNPTHTHDEDERVLVGALPVTEVVQEVQYCTSWNNCITALDTVFMVVTILLCWVLYALVQCLVYSETCNAVLDTALPGLNVTVETMFGANLNS